MVTVAYNAENVIEKTLASVLNQSYLPFEYYIIDGKSTDKTVEIAKKYDLPVIDLYAESKTNQKYLKNDGVHFLKKGYVKLAKKIVAEVKNSIN